MTEKKLGQEPAFPFENIKERANEAVTKWTNYKGMSKRSYAAIKLGVPDSGEEWLDDMIEKSNRRMTACAAMQGMMRIQSPVPITSEIIRNDIDLCYAYADELLKQENEKE